MNDLYLVMAYFDQGDLGTFLKSEKTIPKKQVKTVIKQIVEGLQFLHVRNYTHRDLKLTVSYPITSYRIKISKLIHGFGRTY